MKSDNDKIKAECPECGHVFYVNDEAGGDSDKFGVTPDEHHGDRFGPVK